MRRWILLSGLVFLGLNISCAQNKDILLDDFEQVISGGPEGTVDFGAGNGSALTVTAEKEIKHTGQQSLKANFDAVSGGYMYIARGFGLDAKNTAWLVAPENIEWKKTSGISFWMYGSNSQARVALDIKDNGNEMWRFITIDDFTGWKKIICPWEKFFPRDDWQPESADRNSELNFPLRSYQFEPLPPAKGVIYFDDVELMVK